MLGRIATALELATPLTTRYQLFERTGKPGYADPSKRILAGRMMAPRPDRALPRVISESHRRRAREAYAACAAQLLPRLQT